MERYKIFKEKKAEIMKGILCEANYSALIKLRVYGKKEIDYLNDPNKITRMMSEIRDIVKIIDALTTPICGMYINRKVTCYYSVEDKKAYIVDVEAHSEIVYITAGVKTLREYDIAPVIAKMSIEMLAGKDTEIKGLSEQNRFLLRLKTTLMRYKDELIKRRAFLMDEVKKC